MNDLRRATASLLAVSDSDETVPMPTLSMSLAEFNNLLFQIASYDGFEGETIEEFAKAFAASLNGNAVIEAANGVENFPEVGEDGALYLDTNTGKIYYYEDGEYKQANADTEITEKEIAEAVERILEKDPEGTNKAIADAIEDYLNHNKEDSIDKIINDYLDENKNKIIGEVDDYLANNSSVVSDGIVKYLENSNEVSELVKNEISNNPDALQKGIEEFAKNNQESIDSAIESYLNDNDELISNAVKDKIENESDMLEQATKQYLSDNDDIVISGIDAYLDENKNTVKDGVKDYLNEHKDELGGLIAEHYELEVNDGMDDIEAINKALGESKPIEGNVFIIKHLIVDDKYDYTSYYYDGEKWCAMTGNYNAKNVYFAQDFIVTEPIGTLQDFTGKTTLSAKGKNLVELLESLFATEKAPQVKMPSITITNSTAKNYEVGTLIKPTWIAKFNPGEYEFNESTGVELEGWNISNNVTNEKSTSTSGKFSEIEVTDDMNLTITAKATYSAGIVPVSNLDKPVETSKINAGTISKTSSALKGYRKTFFGAIFEDDEVTPELIRDLESSNSGMKDGSVFSINVGKSATKVIIAYPANLGPISSVKKDGKYEIADKFKLTSMEIEGANGYKAIEYKVYTRVFDKEKTDDCVYNVII